MGLSICNIRVDHCTHIFFNHFGFPPALWPISSHSFLRTVFLQIPTHQRNPYKSLTFDQPNSVLPKLHLQFPFLRYLSSSLAPPQVLPREDIQLSSDKLSFIKLLPTAIWQSELFSTLLNSPSEDPVSVLKVNSAGKYTCTLYNSHIYTMLIYLIIAAS